ncbi:MAG: family hydrolase [Glaciihabitans sp.]|nr:family hydrolase [Glaciihabitans sp.]
MLSAPRLILVDLDGTLLGADGAVSERNAAALSRATDAGSRVVVATGRPARLLGPIRKSLQSSIALCYNGAIVLDLASGAIIDSHLLEGRLFRDAVEALRGDGLEFVVGVEGMPEVGIRTEPGFRPGAAIPRASLDELTTAGIVKGLVRANADQFGAVWDALERFPDTLTVTRSGVDGLIEVSAVGVTKGGVIDGLARGWGIPSAEAIAFGDMPNDLEMLRWAGWSVAMGNAEPEVKLVASEVAEDHDADAVAKVLERWF